jgi:hypothetical protein
MPTQPSQGAIWLKAERRLPEQVGSAQHGTVVVRTDRFEEEVPRYFDPLRRHVEAQCGAEFGVESKVPPAKFSGSSLGRWAQ